MKPVYALTFLAALALGVAPALADDAFVGTIYAPDGGSSNNYTTIVDGGSVPFTIVPNRTYSVQCDAAAAVEAATGSTCSTTLQRGVRLPSAWNLYDVPVRPGQTCIAVKAVSGDVSCNVRLYSENPGQP